MDQPNEHSGPVPIRHGRAAESPGTDRATPLSHEDRATRLQILALQNTTLLANRSQVWGDAAGRVTTFVAILSGSVVALALAAQATAFGQGFLDFALLLLPVVLYSGFVTLGRLAELDNADFRVVQGLNRVQHGLLELDPGSEPYLAGSPYDDWTGISLAYTVEEPVASRSSIIHGLRTLPALLAVINATVAAVLASVVLIQFEFGAAGVVAGGALLFALLFALQARWGVMRIVAVKQNLISHYPSPTNSQEPADPKP